MMPEITEVTWGRDGGMEGLIMKIEESWCEKNSQLNLTENGKERDLEAK